MKRNMTFFPPTNDTTWVGQYQTHNSTSYCSVLPSSKRDLNYALTWGATDIICVGRHFSKYVPRIKRSKKNKNQNMRLCRRKAAMQDCCRFSKQNVFHFQSEQFVPFLKIIITFTPSGKTNWNKFQNFHSFPAVQNYLLLTRKSKPHNFQISVQRSMTQFTQNSRTHSKTQFPCGNNFLVVL